MSEDELAWMVPGPHVTTSSGESTGSNRLPLVPLGRSNSGRVVGIPVEPYEGRHLAVLGETGMGKSSTLVSIARHAVRLGGVILFDPLGETAAAFASEIPVPARSRTTMISPRESRAGINALEGVRGPRIDPVLADRRLNDLVHAFRRVRSGRYVEASFWGPRLEEMVTRALSAAASLPDGTLVDAHTLLENAGRVRQVVPLEAQEAVRELSSRVRDRPEDAEGARRLLYEVVRSPVLRELLCVRSPRLHTGALVGDHCITIISGDASTVGETVARYLLAVYLALIWSELLARSSSPKTFVILDESQWFSHESLAEMLRLARRKNVHVVLATQTVGSLPPAVTDAVWTNVSDFVVFRGSPGEAREISRTSPGISEEELLALPRGRAVVLLGKGNAVHRVRTSGRPVDHSDRAQLSSIPLEPPEPGPAEPVPAPSIRPEKVDGVLDWIAARARDCDASGPVRLELAELRQSVDPTGEAVREVGSWLARGGALTSSQRFAGGTVWVLDRERLRALVDSRTRRGEPPSSIGAEPS